MGKKRRTQLKLYVWRRFCPDYTDGLAFAIAKDEQEAKALVEKYRGYPAYDYTDWGPVNVHSIDHKIAHCVSGGG